VYGERQGDSGEGGVISIFLNRLIASQGLTVYSDGNQTRDFVYVKDVAAANVRALFSPAANRSYNISTMKETSLQELIKLLIQIPGKRPEVIHDVVRNNDIRRSYWTIRMQSISSSEKRHGVFGYEQKKYEKLPPAMQSKLRLLVVREDKIILIHENK
jgi:UDP-glucose 4-epimerase